MQGDTLGKFEMMTISKSQMKPSITSTTKQRVLELEQTRDEINLKLIKEEMKKPTITKEGLMLRLKQIQAMSL